MMTADQTGRKKRPEPSAEAKAAELSQAAKEQSLSLTAPDGLFKQLTKTVLETALNEELTEQHATTAADRRQTVRESSTQLAEEAPPQRRQRAR
ncbi:mobile element protein [Micromonospora sp. B006]|nr:mobile element protein [Micromonospora sp. B006]